MAIVSHEIVWGSENGTRYTVTYKFTSHIGYEPALDIQKLIVRDEAAAEADALSMYAQKEAQLADMEVSKAVSDCELDISPEKVPDHLAQNDYDRRVLGQAMTFTDIHWFYAAYPLFTAMELRGGANAGQRAAYLGVDTTTYGQMEDRFNNVNGVAWFLTDEKAQTWDEVPEGWE